MGFYTEEHCSTCQYFQFIGVLCEMSKIMTVFFVCCSKAKAAVGREEAPYGWFGSVELCVMFAC